VGPPLPARAGAGPADLVSPAKPALLRTGVVARRTEQRTVPGRNRVPAGGSGRSGDPRRTRHRHGLSGGPARILRSGAGPRRRGRGNVPLPPLGSLWISLAVRTLCFDPGRASFPHGKTGTREGRERAPPDERAGGVLPTPGRRTRSPGCLPTPAGGTGEASRT